MELLDSINNFSDTRNINGRWVRILADSKYIEVTKNTGEHRRKAIDTAAIRSGIIPEQFVGFIQCGGTLEEQLRILNSRLTVIGLDSVGRSCVLAAARYGTGEIIGVDNIGEDSLNYEVEQIYKGTNLKIFKGPVREQNVRDIIAFPTNMVISTVNDLQTQFILQAYCKNMCIPYLCISMTDVSAVIVPIFSETKDVSEALKGLSVQDGATTGLPQYNSLQIAHIASQEILKVLVYGTTDLRGKMLFFDFKNNLVLPMNM